MVRPLQQLSEELGQLLRIHELREGVPRTLQLCCTRYRTNISASAAEISTPNEYKESVTKIED